MLWKNDEFNKPLFFHKYMKCNEKKDKGEQIYNIFFIYAQKILQKKVMRTHKNPY